MTFIWWAITPSSDKSKLFKFPSTNRILRSDLFWRYVVWIIATPRINQYFDVIYELTYPDKNSALRLFAPQNSRCSLLRAVESITGRLQKSNQGRNSVIVELLLVNTFRATCAFLPRSNSLRLLKHWSRGVCCLQLKFSHQRVRSYLYLDYNCSAGANQWSSPLLGRLLINGSLTIPLKNLRNRFLLSEIIVLDLMCSRESCIIHFTGNTRHDVNSPFGQAPNQPRNLLFTTRKTKRAHRNLVRYRPFSELTSAQLTCSLPIILSSRADFKFLC